MENLHIQIILVSLYIVHEYLLKPKEVRLQKLIAILSFYDLEPEDLAKLCLNPYPIETGMIN